MKNPIFQKTLSIVIPVFCNQETLHQTFDELIALKNTQLQNFNIEVLFIDDGSKDNSWELLKEIQASSKFNVKLLKFSRNFGQISAILAGYDLSQGDAVITISADLQDPISLIPKMVRDWESGHEVVIANRHSRDDDLTSKLFSKIAYSVARKAIPTMPEGGFDYLLLSKRAAKILCSLKGNHRFFQGDVLWLGFPVSFISYKRQMRKAGKSGWTFRKKLKYFLDLILSSSYFPIRLMSGLGFLFAASGTLYSGIIFYEWFEELTPFNGWAPLMILILIIGGLIMIMLGVIGEYLWRIYDDVKDRPLYIVEDYRAMSELEK